MTDEQLVLVPIPPLLTLLLHTEKSKGSALTEEEVLTLRDNAICMTMPYSAAVKMAESRGYDDIPLETAWEAWTAIRSSLL